MPRLFNIIRWVLFMQLAVFGSNVQASAYFTGMYLAYTGFTQPQIITKGHRGGYRLHSLTSHHPSDYKYLAYSIIDDFQSFEFVIVTNGDTCERYDFNKLKALLEIPASKYPWYGAEYFLKWYGPGKIEIGFRYLNHGTPAGHEDFYSRVDYMNTFDSLKYKASIMSEVVPCTELLF